MVEFSIVLPVYNEEKRISKNIDVIFGFFNAIGRIVEIIFVNDGSVDLTAEVLKSYQKKYTFSVISYEINRGKGYAVRQGALAAIGKWILFFDIDLATPLETFYLLDEKIKNQPQEIIVCSRRMASSTIHMNESKVRTFLGVCFTKLSNLLVPGITDFTCGFKCFSKKAVEIIFPRARINRWGFDTELLYIAHLHALEIKQIPVTWSHDPNSRVKVVKAIISSLKELLTMKINQWRGLYR